MNEPDQNSQLIEVSKISLSEHTNLTLVPAEAPILIPFRELKENSVPILELPPDPCPDIFYPNAYVEPKCVICCSPWRLRVEHEFISQGQKANRVKVFFEKYFGAKITWESISTHMHFHCDLSRIQQDGQLYYQHREDDLSLYKYREDDLALIALTDQLYEIKGMTCKSADLKLKRAGAIANLTKQIQQIKKDRDNNGALQNINFFKVLMDIHDKMKHEEDKVVIRNTVKQLREQLMNENK
jgi:hypothetical protein